MSEAHERLWHEWYALWHDADASKPKPSYDEWLEARIEALEKAVKKVRRMARLSEHDDQDTMEARLQGIERIAVAAHLKEKP